MYRRQSLGAPNAVHSRPEDQRIKQWQKEVEHHNQRNDPPVPPQFIIRNNINNNITTNPPPVVVNRVKDEPGDDTKISTKEIIGVGLGIFAGGCAAYALVKSESESASVPKKRIEHHTVWPPRCEYAGLTKPVQATWPSTRRSPSPLTMIRGRGNTKSNYDTSNCRVSTVISFRDSSAETLGTRPRDSRLGSSTAGSTTEKVIAQSANGTKVILGDSQHFHASQDRRTRATESVKSARSVTAVRVARDVPLPPSTRASTKARDVQLPQSTRASTKTKSSVRYDKGPEGLKKGLPSLAPEDSISQVSTNRPRDRERCSTHSRSKSGHKRSHRHHSSRG